MFIYGNTNKSWSPGHPRTTCICMKTGDEALLVTGLLLSGQGGGTGLFCRGDGESV